ncbi:amino acid ABC transporter permease [Kaustia mangrovi]|uniref:Amino acid ABC transporter permease n=1 Tax=Kaustia mangrovi TaxID=2593653 RepID=A0A7S8HD25_9HYPH|nr:amino acid ABC transporter permease [Kaustia mangrovi]QPC44054.1 amino acid ABC transporter permease [Kaustia mangrovi]
MDLIVQTLPLLARGLAATFQLALITLAVAALISVVFGLMGTSRRRSLRWSAMAFVEFFRDIPLVVNLLFVYFGAPLVGVPLEPFWAAVVSLSSWGGANGAEIVRGGFNAVSKHQRESAAALGLKPWEVLYYVLAPQVLLPILPPFTGLFSILIQATSLASLVGALEFFRTAQIIVERATLMTGHSPAFAVFGFVLCVYFVICFSLATFTRRLERRLADRTSKRGMKVQSLKQEAAESI